jgi:hypothetical protein
VTDFVKTYCNVKSAEGYMCTNDRDHNGPHEARGIDQSAEPYVTWDADACESCGYPNICRKCGHYWDTPNHHYGCEAGEGRGAKVV